MMTQPFATPTSNQHKPDRTYSRAPAALTRPLTEGSPLVVIGRATPERSHRANAALDSLSPSHQAPLQDSKLHHRRTPLQLYAYPAVRSRRNG